MGDASAVTWFCIDDSMLDHEKWIRAIGEGGDAALHLWLRLGTWCARHLTDGVVPAHVCKSLPGPRGGKTRARAWQALADAALIHRHDDGSVTLHDYLDYNPSRAKVLADRQRKTKNKQDQRYRDSVTGDDAPSVDGDRSVPSPPLPSPALSLSRALDASITDPPSSGLAAAALDVARLSPQALPPPSGTETEPAAITWLPEDFRPAEAVYAAAILAGCTRAGVDEFVTYWRGRKLGGEWRSAEAFVLSKLPSIRDREMKARTEARAQQQRQHGRGAPGEHVPEAGIDLDPRYPGGTIREFVRDQNLGDLGKLVHEWKTELRGQGITTMPAELARKTFSGWLKAKADKRRAVPA